MGTTMETTTVSADNATYATEPPVEEDEEMKSSIAIDVIVEGIFMIGKLILILVSNIRYLCCVIDGIGVQFIK